MTPRLLLGLCLTSHPATTVVRFNRGAGCDPILLHPSSGGLIAFGEGAGLFPGAVCERATLLTDKRPPCEMFILIYHRAEAHCINVLHYFRWEAPRSHFANFETPCYLAISSLPSPLAEASVIAP